MEARARPMFAAERMATASANAMPRIMLVWIVGVASGLRPMACTAPLVTTPMPAPPPPPLIVMVLPFIILTFLVRFLRPWSDEHA